MKRENKIKITVILMGLILGLLFSEIGFRLYHYITFENHEDGRIGQDLLINDTDTERSLGQVIRLAEEKKIVYELLPNSTFKFKNAIVKTNDLGFRDKLYNPQKKEGTTRIIGLGDSVMFGWGVEENQCYLDQLETKLNTKNEGNYEIINTAVPGYNTVMEVAVLKNKIDLNEVDIVIINFVHNDFDLPNFVRERPNYWGIKKSMILQYFEDAEGKDKRLRDAPYDGENRRYQRDPKNVSGAYRDLIGEDSCLNALEELAKLRDKYGFKVIFLAHSPFFQTPPSVLEKSKALGFEYVDTKSTWLDYKSKNKSHEWSLSKQDFHPSLVGHTIISDLLFDVIYKETNTQKL